MIRASMRIKCHHRTITSFSSKSETLREKSSMAFSASSDHEKKQGELPIPDFNDAQSAFESKSTKNLLRASLVYTLCGIKPLVNNAEPLLKMTRKVFGDTITDFLLKATLFGHFCAGEDEERLGPVIAELRRNGIGGILDYAAESDADEESPSSEFNQPVREYAYESEAACDRHVEVFRSCIRSVANVSPDGFAAIKVTALGNPLLLERMSLAIVESKNLFARFDGNGDGFINREEFEQGYRY